MNYKKYFGFVLLLVTLLGLAACDPPPAPGRAPVDNSNLTPSSSGTEIEIVTGTPDTQGKNAISGYTELREGQTIDMDFNGSGNEMAYVPDNNSPRTHYFGQYRGDGGGIGLAPVSSIPSYATCKSISGWYPSHSFDLGDIFCFHTWDNTYGYIQIVKLKVEQSSDSATPAWTVGFNYLVWIP